MLGWVGEESIYRKKEYINLQRKYVLGVLDRETSLQNSQAPQRSLLIIPLNPRPTGVFL